MKEIPKELNWITARMQCSIYSLYQKLRLGIEDDIKVRNALPEKPAKFELSSHESAFTVFTQSGGALRSVTFSIENESIVAKGGSGTILFRATVGLDETGECRARVGDSEYELWQLRMKALHALFFDGAKPSISGM